MNRHRSPRRARAYARHTPGEMNKLEQKFSLYLSERQMTGDVETFGFERIKLKLASATFYTPDFDVVRTDGLMDFFETKGGPWEDDARVKIKVAAQTFPQFGFIGVTWDRTDGWKFERFGSAAHENNDGKNLLPRGNF